MAIFSYHNRELGSMHIKKSFSMHMSHLSSSFGVGQLLLKDNEQQCEESHDQAVTSITKHDSKQEWEGDDGVGG